MLFLGLLFDRNEEQLIALKSRGCPLQNQVNTFQWNCIDGFYENGVQDLRIINALPVGVYPKRYTDMIIPSKKWNYNGGDHFQIGSFNLPVLKQWGRYRKCKKILKASDDKNILIYSPYQPFLKAIKKLDKSYSVTLIVPDLPEYYDYASTGRLRKVLRSINNRSIKKCMGRVDRFVLLTEDMKIPLEVGKRPYTVVEGICAAKPSGYVRQSSLDKKVIMYAGSLNKQFGIDILVQAFEQIIDESYELWLCGGGDYVENIKEISKRDERIKFLGFVTKDKVLKLQSQATVLVNPRQNIGEYTKYSFPSKTMEYLLSGVPTVAYKLDGIPDEYDEYFCYVEENTPLSLAQTLKKVCDDKSGHYETVARRAVEFVTKQKNSKVQAKKIMDIVLG